MGGKAARGEVERLACPEEGGEEGEEEGDLISEEDEEGERARGEMREDRGGEPIARREEMESERALALTVPFSLSLEEEEEETWKSTESEGTKAALLRACRRLSFSSLGFVTMLIGGVDDLWKVSGSYSRSDSLREDEGDDEEEEEADSASLTVTFFFFTMGLDDGEEDLRLLTAGEGAGAVEALKLEERSFWPRDAEVEVERRSDPEGGGGRVGFSEEEEGGLRLEDEGEDLSVFFEGLARGEIRSTSPFLLTI